MRSTVDILEGNRFVVSDARGDIDGTPAEPHGFFANDTRFLSLLRMTVNGHRPLLLSSDRVEYFSAAFFLRNAPGNELPQDSLSITRRRFVGGCGGFGWEHVRVGEQR